MGGEPIGLQQDADFARVDAIEIDGRHAFEALEAALQQAVEHLVAVRQVAIAGDAQFEDRQFTE